MSASHGAASKDGREMAYQHRIADLEAQVSAGHSHHIMEYKRLASVTQITVQTLLLVHCVNCAKYARSRVL